MPLESTQRRFKKIQAQLLLFLLKGLKTALIRSDGILFYFILLFWDFRNSAPYSGRPISMKMRHIGARAGYQPNMEFSWILYVYYMQILCRFYVFYVKILCFLCEDFVNTHKPCRDQGFRELCGFCEACIFHLTNKGHPW